MNVIKVAAISALSTLLVAIPVACSESDDAASGTNAENDSGLDGTSPSNDGSRSADATIDGGDTPFVAYGAYCDKLADEALAFAKRCARIPADEEAAYRASVLDACRLRKEPVEIGSQVYDGTAAGRCTEAMSKATCNMAGGSLCDNAGVFPQASNLAAGKPCEGTASCAAGLACAGDPRCRRCTPIVVGGIGAACPDASRPCDASVAYCSQGTCKAWRAVGAFCTTPGGGGLAPERCNPNTSYCEPSTPNGPTGTCAAPKSLGESCAGCYPYETQQTCCSGALACDSNGNAPPSCKTKKNLGEECHPYYTTCAEGLCLGAALTGGTSTCQRASAPGVACTSNLDCMSNVCDPVSKVCVGGTPGTACLVSMDLCNDQTYCKANPTPDGAPTNAGTCTLRGAAGGSCGNATASHLNTCQDGLLCRGDTCVARVPGASKANEACLDSTDCELSAYCPEQAGRRSCVPRGAPGAACYSYNNTRVLECADGAFCSSSNRCEATKQLGERCTGPDCRFNAVCAAGAAGPTCVKLAAVGASCASGERCTSRAWCSSGTCVERRANGATCTTPDECLSSICADNAGVKTCTNGCPL